MPKKITVSPKYKLPLKTYSDFRGGWNADSAPDEIADNELSIADDMDLGVRGGVKRRKGYLQLNPISYGTQVHQTIEYTKNDGTVQILGAIGTNLVKINETDWSIESVLCPITRNDIPNYQYGDKLFFVDGAKYKVYDGSTVRDVQLEAPSSAPVLGTLNVSAPTINIYGTEYTGLRKFRAMVVFTDLDGKELGCSSIGMCETHWNNITNIEWTNIPLGPAGTAHRKLYHGEVLGKTPLFGFGYSGYSNVLYLIGSINDNTTTTYSENPFLGGGAEYIPPSISGIYKGWVTFVQADGFESDPSPTAVTSKLSNLSIMWSNIPIGPPGTVARRLYRTVSGGNIGKVLTTISDNTTTTYSDTSSDNDLGLTELITDNDLSQVNNCDIMVYHKNSGRVFVASLNSANIGYSEQNRPEYFRSWVTPTDGDGPVVDMFIMGDALVVQYANTTWCWRGQNPDTDAIWQELPMPGCYSKWGVAKTPTSTTWIGPGGIYSTDPGILALAGVKLETKQSKVANFAENKIQTVIDSLTSKNEIAAAYDSDKARVYFAHPDGNQIIVLDWTLKAFTRYSNIRAIHLLRRRNGDILASTDGYIVKLNGAVNDPGNVPVAMKYLSKPYHLDYPFHKKRFLRLYTEFKSPDNGDVEFTINIYVDSILVYSQPHASVAESFVWGESTWGEAIWGQRELIALRSKISTSGHRVRVEVLCNQLDIDDVQIYGFGFEYKPIRARGVRV